MSPDQIPDRIPDFPDRRSFKYEVPVGLSKEMHSFAEIHSITFDELARRFFLFGMMIEKTEEEGGMITIRTEKEITLFGEEDVKEEPEGLYLRLTLGRARQTVDAISEIAGFLQEISNKKHKTVEELCTEIMKKGLEAARADDDPNSTIILTEADDNERVLKIF